MGNGEFAYGHGQQIFLKGKKLTDAEKAKARATCGPAVEVDGNGEAV